MLTREAIHIKQISRGMCTHYSVWDAEFIVRGGTTEPLYFLYDGAFEPQATLSKTMMACYSQER